MQVPLSIQILPWSRAQLYVQQGKADAFVAYPSEQRRQYTQVSLEPVADWSVALYTWVKQPKREQLARVSTVAQLAPFRLGAVHGNSWVDEQLKGMTVEHTATVENLLRMLVAGRIEALPDSPAVVHYYLKQAGLKDQVRELQRLATRQLHLCIGRQSPYLKLLPGFDKTLREMRKEGTQAAILAKYQ